MKYKVNVKEVHNLEVAVEAESKEQAKLIVRGALARADEDIINYDFLTYSHSEPMEKWTVSENHDS